MANRAKNDKFPYGADVHLLKHTPPPEETKHWGRRAESRYCKKLKGGHDFDFSRESVHEWYEGGMWICLYYRCVGCNKQELLSYDEP